MIAVNQQNIYRLNHNIYSTCIFLRCVCCIINIVVGICVGTKLSKMFDFWNIVEFQYVLSYWENLNINLSTRRRVHIINYNILATQQLLLLQNTTPLQPPYMWLPVVYKSISDHYRLFIHCLGYYCIYHGLAA